jgi:hypothetical protein
MQETHAVKKAPQRSPTGEVEITREIPFVSQAVSLHRNLVSFFLASLLESESIREKETKKNTQTMKMIQNIQSN